MDEATCGRQRSPCRSISQALSNASTGDSILVGPGHYGDLNEDGALGGVGEETGICAIGNGIGALIGDGGSNHLLIRNAFIGNGSVGVNVLPLVTGLVVRGNNIFGNDTQILDGANRGLINSSRSLVLATNNFWGSDTGPGPDPADEVLSNNLSETRFLPFAVKPFKIPRRDD